MKKNKVLSSLLAFTAMIVSITPMFSSANFYLNKHSTKVQQILDDYELIGIETEGVYGSETMPFKKYIKKRNENSNFYHMFGILEDKFNRVSFTIDHDLYYYDELIEILESYGYSNIDDEFDKPEYSQPSKNSETLMEETSPYMANFYMVAYDELPYEKSIEKAKEVCEILKEKGFITGCKYFERKVYFLECYPTVYTDYRYKSESSEEREEEVKNIQKYIDEHNLDCTVKTDDEDKGHYEVIPNKVITIQEHLDIAEELDEKFDLISNIGYMESEFVQLSESDSFQEPESTIAGDVNLDGKVDVADVVAISAYTGDAENNSFKSEQQIINGDVHNTGDGLTANDALMIQQYLAGMIDSLE